MTPSSAKSALTAAAVAGLLFATASTAFAATSDPRGVDMSTVASDPSLSSAPRDDDGKDKAKDKPAGRESAGNATEETHESATAQKHEQEGPPAKATSAKENDEANEAAEAEANEAPKATVKNNNEEANEAAEAEANEAAENEAAKTPAATTTATMGAETAANAAATGATENANGNANNANGNAAVGANETAGAVAGFQSAPTMNGTAVAGQETNGMTGVVAGVGSLPSTSTEVLGSLAGAGTLLVSAGSFLLLRRQRRK